ncbi:hypothetical protein [Paenirhodobacter enshiensis]|uniref:hypothetical protein n=1 Tax=Paenirhodobacter enshiensis TaxID=1105367 RepID=UPI0035B14C3B
MPLTKAQEDALRSGRRPHQPHLAIGVDEDGQVYHTVMPLLTEEEFWALNDRMGYELDDDDELRLVHGRDYGEEDGW